MGPIKFKKRATNLKKSIARGVGKTFDKHRLMKSSDASSSSTTSSFGRPLVRRSRRNSDITMSKLYCFGKRTSKDDGPNMIAFATSASTVIAESYSDDHSESLKQHHIHSDLYRASSVSRESQVVHPVICKRDIYIGAEAQKASGQAKLKKDPETYKTLVAIDPPARNDGSGTRRVMRDVSNRSEPKSRHVPSYSVSGSMLYRNLEKSKTKTSVANAMMSPQKPTGLPANSIMASMLFRTLESTGSMPDSKLSSDSDDSVNKSNIPPHLIGSKGSFPESSVSSVTMNSASHVDPLVRASSTLLSRLLDSGGLDAEEQSALYEM